jgi:uncharacterized membrane protein HdeD (DUF308 family)
MQTANGCSAVEKVRRYQENIMSNVKTTDLQSSLEEFKKHELSHLSNEWWCFLITGLLLVLAGTFSIAYPLFTSVGVVILIGAILIICGVTTVISAFWAGKWSAFFVHILSGLVYVVAGFMITEMPVESLALFTLMLAGLFVVGGSFRIVMALIEKYPQWGWGLVNGIVTLLLGLIIFRAFRHLPDGPSGVLWVIGLFVGLELLFNGWTWIMLSFAIKKLPRTEENAS